MSQISGGGVGPQQQQQKKIKRVRRAITGAANNGVGLIRITAAGHGFEANNWLQVTGVGGTVEANGLWRITVITANTFDLIGSTFTNLYTNGGEASRP